MRGPMKRTKSRSSSNRSFFSELDEVSTDLFNDECDEELSEEETIKELMAAAYEAHIMNQRVQLLEHSTSPCNKNLISQAKADYSLPWSIYVSCLINLQNKNNLFISVEKSTEKAKSFFDTCSQCSSMDSFQEKMQEFLNELLHKRSDNFRNTKSPTN